MGRVYQAGEDTYIEVRSRSTTVYTSEGERRIELDHEQIAPLLAGLIITDHESRERLRFDRLEDVRLEFREVVDSRVWTAPLPDDRRAIIVFSPDSRTPMSRYQAWIADARTIDGSAFDDADPEASPMLIGPQPSYSWMAAVARCADMALILTLETGNGWG